MRRSLTAESDPLYLKKKKQQQQQQQQHQSNVVN